MSLTTIARISTVSVILLGLSHAALAQTSITATAQETPAPDEIAAPIRAELDPAATVVKRGTNTIEFWLRKSVPLKESPEAPPVVQWEHVPDGALVGVMRVARALREIRGLPIRPGVYTLRFALQPQDGAHIGTSPYREFLMVGPAAEDQSLEPVGYAGAVALAQKAAGRGHPLSLSIDPPVASQTAREVVTNDAGHRSVIFSLPVVRKDKTAGVLSFGLILDGTIEH